MTPTTKPIPPDVASHPATAYLGKVWTEPPGRTESNPFSSESDWFTKLDDAIAFVVRGINVFPHATGGGVVLCLNDALDYEEAVWNL